MEDDKLYRALRGGSWRGPPCYTRVAFSGQLVLSDHYYDRLGLRLFLFTSDLELLASPTRELSNGKG